VATCYKHRTIPCLPQEVLMPRASRRLGVSQPTLFHPPPPRPHFQMLPPDIQERTIRLLARLLRRHADQPLGSGEAQEARDE